MSWRILPLLLPWLAAPPMAMAQEVPLRGVLALQGKQVPLPPGEWLVAGRSAAGDVVGLALLQLREGAVVAAVLVQASRLGSEPRWGVAPACDRRDLPLARVHYRSDHDASCAWVAHVAEPAGGAAPAGAAAPADAAWTAARAQAAARGWAWPAAWGVAGIRVAAPVSAVQLRYAFAAGSLAGSGPAASSGEAEAAALAAWTPAAWDRVARGLRNAIETEGPLPPPFTAAPAPDWALPPPPTGLSIPQAIWKTVTFRLLSSTVDFAGNLVATGSLATAAGLSMLPIVIGPFVYLGHELAWEHFGGPAERQVELPGLGPETPFPERRR